MKFPHTSVKLHRPPGLINSEVSGQRLTRLISSLRTRAFGDVPKIVEKQGGSLPN